MSLPFFREEMILAKTKKTDNERYFSDGEAEYFSDGTPVPEEPVSEEDAPEDDPVAEYERLLDVTEQMENEEEQEDYTYGLVNIRIQMLQLAIAAYGKRNGGTASQPAFLVNAAKTFEAYVLEAWQESE